MLNIIEGFRQALLRSTTTLTPTDGEVLVADPTKKDNSKQRVLRIKLTTLASKLFAMINAGEAVVTPLIDDGDAGVTVTSADQTHATPVVTIPNIGDAADSFVMNDTAATLTNKTLTSPVLNTPKIGDGDLGLTVTSANQTNAAATATVPDIGDAADEFLMKDTAAIVTNKSGIILTKMARFVETATGVSHVATIAIPAGAILHSIKVVAEVLWGATTSATLKVGDTANDDGYFIGVDLKATDLLVGEVLETNNDALWGGVEGAYLVAATGQRGPAATNFAMYYAAGTNILATIDVVDPVATTGRTVVVVEYSVPAAITPVVT